MAPAWILIPLISAFIGWFTNWIAIKMLFHPREPKKLLGITIHGIFPKRQRQFAEKLGKLVSEELLSFRDIEEKITHSGNMQHIMPLVEEHIDHFLRLIGQSRTAPQGLQDCKSLRKQIATSFSFRVAGWWIQTGDLRLAAEHLHRLDLEQQTSKQRVPLLKKEGILSTALFCM